MRIRILNQSFHPDVVAVAQHAADLAAALSSDGHSVTVVASRRAFTDASIQFPARGTWKGCTIRRLPSLGLGKQEKWRRVLDSCVLLATFLCELLRPEKFDLTIAMTHPPLVAFMAALAKEIRGGWLVSWVMDLNPDEAIAAGWLPAASWSARILNSLLRFSLRGSDRIIVMDRFMQQRMRDKGVPADKLTVIPPWAHDDSVRYDEAGRARFRKTHGLTGKFVVMYSGNLSLVHPLDTLLTAAARLRDHNDIVFCFIGGGASLPAVRAFASQNGLDNIICLPYQAREDLRTSLSSADLHVVVMGNEMVGIVHPCKVYNILALGIPFLHVGPRRNHVVEIMETLRSPGGAYHAGHEDVESAVLAILDAAQRRLGRLPELAAAAKAYSQRRLLSQMLACLYDVAAPPRAAVAANERWQVVPKLARDYTSRAREETLKL
jgi:glycosyltransferase involved in cell wall biosynthesis